MPGTLSRGLRRTLNTVGGAAEAVGIRVELSPSAIVSAARKRTGLEVLGPMAYPDGLPRLCNALNHEAALTPLGRLAARVRLRLAVVNRLRLIEARRLYPAIFAAELRPFVLICGMPVAGGSLLHRMLCSSPDAWGPPAWEAAEPIADPLKDTRRADLRGENPDAPVESISLLDASFWSLGFCRMGTVDSYQRWLLLQDPEPAYAMYRDFLLWLQAQHPDRTLVLKAPEHVGFLHTLHRVLPEGRLVHLHRAPTDAIPNYCALLDTAHRRLSSARAPESLGGPALALWGHLIDQGLRARDAAPQLEVLDIAWRTLSRSPVTEALAVARFGGLVVTDDTRVRYAAHLAGRQSHDAAIPRCELDDYNLNEWQIRSRFTSYLRRHPEAHPRLPAH